MANEVLERFTAAYKALLDSTVALLTGRSGGQTITGGTGTGEDLTLKDNATDNNTTTVTLIRAGLLTGTQKTDLTDAGDSTLHYHSTDRNTDNHSSGTTNKVFTATEQTKLSGIETGAEVNNISDVNATDLTDGGVTTLHKHTPPLVKTFTRDVSTASGTQEVAHTGGVAPRLIKFDFYATTSLGTPTGSGSDDGTTHACVSSGGDIWLDPPGANQYSALVSTSFSLKPDLGTDAAYEGYVSAWDADSFTITWTKTGTPTGTLTVIATLIF